MPAGRTSGFRAAYDESFSTRPPCGPSPEHVRPFVAFARIVDRKVVGLFEYLPAFKQWRRPREMNLLQAGTSGERPLAYRNDRPSENHLLQRKTFDEQI